MSATLAIPFSVFVSNDEVFIADMFNHRIRKVLKNGHIVTIAGVGGDGFDGDGQLATVTKLGFPVGVVVSSSNQVYISEGDHRIRKIDRNGIMSTVAGTGEQGYNGDDQLAIHAQLNEPRGLFVTEDDEVYFCDRNNHRVRMVDRNGIIRTIAGNGIEGYNGDDQLATDANLSFPTGIYVYKNEIYFTDTYTHRIRKVLQNGMIKTIAGTGKYGYNGDDQPAIYSQINHPYGIQVHNDHVYFSDYSNNRVRKILPNGIIKTIGGTGIGHGNPLEPTLKFPAGIFVYRSEIYIACSNDSRIRKIDQNGIVTTIVGSGETGFSGDVPFDFEKYPHIGPKKKELIKPFPQAYYDLIVINL